MELIVEEFNKLIENKNKEIENLIILKGKNKNLKDNTNIDDISNISLDQPLEDKDIIDYRTKQTISKILTEQDRKLKSSKAYKKKQDINI